MELLLLSPHIYCLAATVELDQGLLVHYRRQTQLHIQLENTSMPSMYLRMFGWRSVLSLRWADWASLICVNGQNSQAGWKLCRVVDLLTLSGALSVKSKTNTVTGSPLVWGSMNHTVLIVDMMHTQLFTIPSPSSSQRGRTIYSFQRGSCASRRWCKAIRVLGFGPSRTSSRYRMHYVTVQLYGVPYLE